MIIDVGYQPREQFVGFHKRKERFACVVSHRRAGKTVACVNDLQDGALRCELVRPRFAYVAPFRHQAKTVAWDYLRQAMSELRPLGATVHDSELRVDYPNGGQVRLYGADNPDALRGQYFDGIVLDEFADMDPAIWSEVVRPALSDRRGWAVFIGTPKGHNEFYKLYQRSQSEPDWFSLMLKASETGLITTDELESARRDLTEDQYAQEYECSFDAAITGSYWGKDLRKLEEAKQICGVPYDHMAQVWTAWDLGFRDATAVWFAQKIGKEIHLIDFYQSTNATIEDDVRAILAKPYSYAGHIVPHDAFATSKQTGRTTADFMGGLGLRGVDRCPDHRREDGISRVSLLLPRCWFDKDKTAAGLEALRLYRAEFDEKLKTLKPVPLHDWASHPADAFRYLAMAIDEVGRGNFNREIKYKDRGKI